MYDELGRMADFPAAQVVKAAGLIKQGKMISLASPRFPGMPLFPGHPPFQVLNARTPRGIRTAGLKPWGEVNDVGLGYMAEYLMCTSHSGAHIDALAHMTIGEDMHWYGGGNPDEHLTANGPVVGDASKLPPFFTRGVLVDVPGFRGTQAMDGHEPVYLDEVQAILAAEGVTVQPYDVVLFRTGYLSFWPDEAALIAHRGAGPDISVARWLLEQGVVATGSDTESFEVQPAPDKGPEGNPQPVHTALLIENGLYIMESVDLEQLAEAKIYEFCFVALPLKIKGATGSMIDPVAIV
ncbi:MAG: cyclase family protein [Propionibacteriaceae bacterium]|jgi:kynurenine formamidase|nr:cyclase family protein [Propionibacteriaceae bacterium]